MIKTIAVITNSEQRFREWLRYVSISPEIEFKRVDNPMHVRGIHSWIGYVILPEEENIVYKLDEIIYNIKARTMSDLERSKI